MENFSKLILKESSDQMVVNVRRFWEVNKNLVEYFIKFPITVRDGYIISDMLPNGEGTYYVKGWIETRIQVDHSNENHGVITEVEYQELIIEDLFVEGFSNVYSRDAMIKQDILNLFNNGYHFGIEDAQVEFVR